jgi:hypothetical protein
MRTGWLDERETYKKMQAHMIEHLMLEIFESWLEASIMNGAVKLPMAKFDAFNKPVFMGRKWPWVDPQKDITAQLMAVSGNIKTLEQVIEESDSSSDIEETFTQRGYETELAKKHGIKCMIPAGMIDPDAQQANQDGEEGEGESESEKMRLNAEAVKQEMDAYGVGVRAGTITPQTEDENFYRKKLGLPAMSTGAKAAWKEDEGYRRPITLVQEGTAAFGQPAAPPDGKEKPTEDDDAEE